MKKFKSLLTLIIGIIATAVLAGCGCSKEVNPVKIEVDVTTSSVFAGDKVDITYSISPVDSTKTDVTISTNKSEVVSLSATSLKGVSGKVTVTALKEDIEGATITFTVSGTKLKATSKIIVLPDPIKLDAPDPTYTSFINGTNKLKFKVVPHASSYEVDIDGVVYSVADPEPNSGLANRFIEFPVFTEDVDLLYNQGHVVKVRAIGDGTNYSTSDYSSEYKFIKLSSVDGLSFNNGTLTWNSNELADRYQLEINGVPQQIYATTNTYKFGALNVGSYALRVKASHSVNTPNEQGYYIFEGDYSEVYTIYRMGKPTVTLANSVVTNGVTGYSEINWSEVPGAESYTITISPSPVDEVSSLTVLATEPRKIVLDENYLTGVAYTFTVSPVGGATTFGGDSAKLTATKTAQVSNFTLTNNILSFNGIEQSGGYELVLTSDNETKAVKSTANQFDLAENINGSGTYSLSIRTLGTTKSGLTLANSNAVNTNLSIVKLSNPQVQGVNNLGVVSYSEIANASSYQIYLDNNYVATTSAVTYALNFADLTSGSHTVKVQAIGNGTNIISSGLENAIEYEFSKLPTVSSVTVLNDVISFNGVEGAVNYSIKVNDAAAILNGVNDEATEQTFKVTNSVVNGINYIKIVTIGDGVKTISSDEKTFEITRLNTAQNLRVENGVLSWDSVANCYYLVFVGDDENGVKVTTGSYNNFVTTNQDVVVKVKAFTTEGGYLSSDFATITVNKLSKVEANSIAVKPVDEANIDNLNSNYKLVWSEVTNATGYNITIADTLQNEIQKEYKNVTNNYLEIPNNYVADTYTIEIYALGNSATTTVGYLNSEVASFQFKKLAVPTNLAITNGILTWSYTGTPKPNSYTIGIVYNGGAEVFVQADATCAYDLSAYGTDPITVRVRANGNNETLVTGNYSEPFSVTRLSQVNNLRVVNGVITFDKHEVSDVGYYVYVNNELAENAVITVSDTVVYVDLPSLNENTNYQISVQAYLQGYLVSEKTSEITVNKLATVTNFDINNKVFSWDANTNATGYEVVSTNNVTKQVTSNSLNFDEFGFTDSGVYNFNIRAIGNTTTGSQVGYLTSAYNVEGLEVKIAPAPSIKIQNSKLVITPNANEKLIPENYKVEVVNDSDEVVATQIFSSVNNSFDLTTISLAVGSYTIKLYSESNNKNIIGLSLPSVLENVQKLNKDHAGLKIKGGEVWWTNTIIGATFDVYLQDDTQTVKLLENYARSTYEFANLEKGKEYFVYVVIKQNGAIDSDKSNPLSVTKLPDVSGLKLINDEGIIKFSWNSITTETSYTDVNKFYYEVYPVTALEPFNGKTANGSVNKLQLVFDYPSVNQAQFKVRAMGTISEETKGYLNGDLSSASLTINKLLGVENISINNNLLTWQNVSNNATGIKLIFTVVNADNVESAEVFEFDLSAETTSFNVTENLDPNIYSLKIITLGNIENALLNSNIVIGQNVEVLEPVSIIITNNGYLQWTQLDNGVVYEVYADGEKLIHTETLVDPETSEETTVTLDYFTSFAESEKINDLLPADKNIAIKIRSKKLESTENTLTFYSKFSEEFIVNKLRSISDAHFENNLLKWSAVPNATGYVVKVLDAEATEVFAGASDFDAVVNGLKVMGDEYGKNGYELPNTIAAGDYSFYVVALGSTTTKFTELGYLTGDKSNLATVTILAEPENLMVKNGNIVWDEVIGAEKYKVAVSKVLSSGVQTETVFFTGKNSEGLSADAFDCALYSVTITVIGNGVTILNSNPTTLSTIKVYKPKAVQNYKVVNGFVYWEMPFNDELMLALNGNQPYEDAQKREIVDALVKRENAGDPSLFTKYEFLTNVEATINNIVFTNLHPYTIELDEKDKAFIKFTFDFNFTEVGLRNKYNIKLRYLGSGFNTDINLGGGGGETEGGEGEEGAEVVSNFVNGVYSNEISAYKLPAPQTPIVGFNNIMTMVKNNKIYFMSVAASSDFVVDYLITAISSSKVIYQTVISGTDTKYLSKDSSDNILSENVYCVPISDLGLDSGDQYTLDVRAIGTKDSAKLEAGKDIYLTSNYQNSCIIQILRDPTISVSMGEITTSIPAYTQTLYLQIWDARIGDKFDINKNNEEEGIVAANIIINSDTIQNNAFLNDIGGYYTYTLSNNPQFKDGKYYVQCIAEGDGISQVSSDASNVLTIYKTTGIKNVTLKDGKFTWDHVTYTSSNEERPVSISAAGYLVEIIQTAYINNVMVEGSEFSVSTYTVLTKDIAGDDKSRCYFDLPSNSAMYPATKTLEDGTIVTYKYSAIVRVRGTDKDDENFKYGGANVVNSDATKSREYTRLSAPLNLRMVNGTLQWNAVNNAVSYEVYMLDITYGYPEEEVALPEGPTYGIISNGDIRQLDFEGLNLKVGKLYSIIIRALPGGGDTENLNGEYSPEIFTRKLDKPNIRIEDGVIKWNVTELDLAVATKVNITVTGPSGFNSVDISVDVNNEVNGQNGYKLWGSDSEYPVGDYTVKVWFSGSNGLIPTAITDPDAPDPEEPTDPDNPGNGETEIVAEGGDGSESGEGGEEKQPQLLQDAYCWFSSDETSITATKLNTLVATRYKANDQNYIRVSPVDNATYYVFTVVKYDEVTNEVIKTYTTPKYRLGSVDNVSGISYDEANKYILYNLAYVSEYDELHQGESILFGTNYSVYAQAFANDSDYTKPETKYIISNPSNLVSVEIPVAPSNLNFEEPGTITWTNKSNNTHSRVKVEYDGRVDPDSGDPIPYIYDLAPGVNSFKLKDIGIAKVSVLSYLITEGEGGVAIEVTSPYTEYEQKISYMIYASGSGTVENPYVIATTEHVNAIKYNMDSHFKLNNNITYLSGTSVNNRPQYLDGMVINGVGTAFTGSLDGCGFTISGINYTDMPYFREMAFVHTIGSTGEIKNLTLSIMGSNVPVAYFGGVAIYNNGIISNVNVKLETAQDFTYNNGSAVSVGAGVTVGQIVAGIAVYNNRTIINSTSGVSFASSTTIRNSNYVAGVAGINKGAITYSANSGKLNGAVVGGISAENNANISKCYNTGDIMASVTTTIQTIGGGIVALNRNATDLGYNASVVSCYAIINNFVIATQNTTSGRGVAGGIVGTNQSTVQVTNSYVVINRNNSVTTTNSVFGIVLGSSSNAVTNVTNNNGYLLVSGGSYNTYGNDATKTIAERFNTKETLVNTFTTNTTLSQIYKKDDDNVNNGYPVFK